MSSSQVSQSYDQDTQTEELDETQSKIMSPDKVETKTAREITALPRTATVRRATKRDVRTGKGQLVSSRSTIEQSVDRKPQFEIPTPNSASGMSTADSPVVSDYNELTSLESLKNERGQWANQVESLLSLIGVMVGFGNLWRFPYLVFTNGGGAYFIPYLVLVFLVGIPLVYLELVIGQYSSFGPVGVFANISPIFEGLGWATVLTTVLLVIYYNVLTSWSIFYLFQSFRTHVPWRFCNHEWNTDYCYILPQGHEPCPNGTINLHYNRCFNASANLTALKPHLEHSAADEFFYECLYSRSANTPGYGYLQGYLCLCLLGAWCLVMLSVFRGVRSMGVIVYFTTCFLFVSLLVFAIYTSTLHGATEGIKYYLTPRTAHLKEPHLWIAAATQSYFTLTVGHGVETTLASYNKFNNNCFRDAIVASLFNTLASLLAGITVSSMLGFVAHKQGFAVEDLVRNSTLEGGRSLAFIALGDGIAHVSGDPVWSFVLFTLFIVAGLSTLTGAVEVIVTAVCDQFPYLLRYRLLVIAAVCAICYLLGLPMCLQRGYTILDIFDTYSNVYSCFFIVITELFCCIYVYGIYRFISNIISMLGPTGNIVSKIIGPTGWFWWGTWLLTCPVLLLAMRITAAVHERTPLSRKEQLLGLLLSFAPVAVTLLFATVRVVRQLLSGTEPRSLIQLLQPTDKWCPLHQRRDMKIEKRYVHRIASLDMKKSTETALSYSDNSISTD